MNGAMVHPPWQHPDMDDSLSSLEHEAIAFRDARDWSRFHTPKDLVLGLLAEAGELAEVVLWKTPEELEALRTDAPLRGRLADELADVQIYLLYLAHGVGLDLAAAVRSKIAANGRKYPVEKARGSAAKYDEL